MVRQAWAGVEVMGAGVGEVLIGLGFAVGVQGFGLGIEE